jgi:FMN reductase (NADPH)
MESLQELYAARFGAAAAAALPRDESRLTETHRVQLAHRSVRKFTTGPVPEPLLTLILAAAQSAPTSSNLNAYSVLVVRDPEVKRELARLAGDQSQVAQCPVFLLFAPDIHRLNTICNLAGAPPPESNVELLLLAAVDAALAGMNAMTAAEAAGLGAVMIGGVRNSPAEISALLELPAGVIPLFGMCIGFPAEPGAVRARPAPAGMIHQEKYHPEQIEPALNDYAAVMQPFFASRGLKQADGSPGTWLSHTAARLRPESMRGHLRDFLIARGFALR